VFAKTVVKINSDNDKMPNAPENGSAAPVLPIGILPLTCPPQIQELGEVDRISLSFCDFHMDQ